MTSILKPFSNIAAPGTQQVPTGWSAIDWTNSLTTSLIGCWVPGIFYGRDVSSQVSDLTIKANAKFISTLEGPCLWSDNAGSGDDDIRGTATAPFKNLGSAGGALTIYWRGSISSQTANGSNANICGVTVDNAGGSPFFVGSIAPGSGGQYPTISVYFSSAGALSHLDVASIVNNFNVMYSFMATFVSGGNTIFYNNGISAGTTGFAGSATTSATSQICIGGDGSTQTRSSHSQTNLAVFWNRALSAGEALAMHLNPYGILIPAEYELPTMQQQAGTTAFRRSLSALGTRTGTRQVHG